MDKTSAHSRYSSSKKGQFLLLGTSASLLVTSALLVVTRTLLTRFATRSSLGHRDSNGAIGRNRTGRSWPTGNKGCGFEWCDRIAAPMHTSGANTHKHDFELDEPGLGDENHPYSFFLFVVAWMSFSSPNSLGV